MKYYADEKIKIKLLKLWLADDQECKKKRVISHVFTVIGLILCLGFTLFMGVSVNTVTGWAAGAGFGIFLGIIPFGIGNSIITTARAENEYSLMENEVLSLFDEGIELTFYPGENRYRMSGDTYRDILEKEKRLAVYSIAKEELNAVNYDSKYGMIILIGKGNLTYYDDYFGNRINKEKSANNFHETSPFSFILPFEERDKIASLIRDKSVNGGFFT